MARTIRDDLTFQFQHTFRILYEEIERFSDEQWVSGISFFQVPVKQAMHLFECLDFYFADSVPGDFKWGARFSGGWWELSADLLPDKVAILTYARELETRIFAQLATWTDADLAQPLPFQFDWATTRIGMIVYALKHTLHHHGQIAALAVRHGLPGGSWE
jgi:uncharacterized damage-inducible protein DinB